MAEVAKNYDSSATFSDNSCAFKNMGCTDPVADNFESKAEIEHFDPNFGCKCVAARTNPSTENRFPYLLVAAARCERPRVTPHVSAAATHAVRPSAGIR